MSEPNKHTTKWFPENLLAVEKKKMKVKMDKPTYLGISVIEISKTLMYEFQYDYIKPKYQNNAKLCYMDTGSFIIHIKTEIFMNILLMILKNGLTYQISLKIDHY